MQKVRQRERRKLEIRAADDEKQSRMRYLTTKPDGFRKKARHEDTDGGIRKHHCDKSTESALEADAGDKSLGLGI